MRVQGATSVLSNFFMWSIQFMGMLFPSVDHAYQFLKARFHGRPNLCQQILKAPTAAAAKQIAKQIQVTNDWNDRRQFLMADFLDLKFVFVLLSDRHCFHPTTSSTTPYPTPTGGPASTSVTRDTERFWSPPRQTWESSPDSRQDKGSGTWTQIH